MPTFDTPAHVELKIRLPKGRVAVETVEQRRTVVELRPFGRAGEDVPDDVVVTAAERKGGHVIVIEQEDRRRFGPLKRSRGGGVEVRVTCPEGAALDLSGASTELDAEGRLGEVSVRTATGDVRLGTVGGKLEVKTASGDIAVARIESTASLATVSGDLDVGRVEGSLTVRSVSGDVEISVTRGAVTVSSTSGNVDLKSVCAGGVQVHTVSGDTRIGVSRGTRVWIDASSLSGELDSELSVGGAELEPGEDEVVVPLHVNTVSGDVSVVRASEVVQA